MGGWVGVRPPPSLGGGDICRSVGMPKFWVVPPLGWLSKTLLGMHIQKPPGNNPNQPKDHRNYQPPLPVCACCALSGNLAPIFAVVFQNWCQFFSALDLPFQISRVPTPPPPHLLWTLYAQTVWATHQLPLLGYHHRPSHLCPCLPLAGLLNALHCAAVSRPKCTVWISTSTFELQVPLAARMHVPHIMGPHGVFTARTCTARSDLRCVRQSFLRFYGQCLPEGTEVVGGLSLPFDSLASVSFWTFGVVASVSAACLCDTAWVISKRNEQPQKLQNWGRVLTRDAPGRFMNGSGAQGIPRRWADCSFCCCCVECANI